MRRPCFSSRLVALMALLSSLGLISASSASLASEASPVPRYVALGDSLTAAFAGGGLHQDAQRSGYPRLLSERIRGLALPFEQPLMTDPGIPAVLRRRQPSTADTLARLAPGPGLGSPINLTLPRPYDNLAVPGAKVADLLRTSTDGGGFHDLVLRGLGTQLEQALLLEPQWVSLWVGASDALGAAISGIVLDGVTLTPADRFSADLNAIVQSLVAGGVGSGVVATIPRPTDLPYVNTLPAVAVDPGSGVPLEVDGKAVPLIGPDGPLSAQDSVLLSASPLLARGDGVSAAHGGSGVPLPDSAILSRVEALQIDRRIAEYNRIIRRAAADVGFAVVDAAALFEEWHRSGVDVGTEYTSRRIVAGGLFSLDGVHPSPLGHALLANRFIEAINRTYGAALEPVRLPELPKRPSDARVGQALENSPGSVLFSARASKNLRFGLGVPRSGRLMKLKRKALDRLRKLERRRRQRRYELPSEPKLASSRNPAIVRVSAL